MEELHDNLINAARQLRRQIQLGNLSHALFCGRFADPLSGVCGCGMDGLVDTLDKIEQEIGILQWNEARDAGVPCPRCGTSLVDDLTAPQKPGAGRTALCPNCGAHTIIL